MQNLIDQKNLELIVNKCNFSIFEQKKVLITGGTGMVGSYLAEAIIRGAEAQDVKITEMKITGKTYAPESVKRFSKYSNVNVSIDLLDDPIKNCSFQIVFHLASPASPTQYKDYETLLHVNSDCLLNIIRGNTEKFIFVSTGEVYGNRSGSLSEDNVGIFDAKSPRDWYPLAKLKGEEISTKLCADFKSELNIVRLFHTFGPGVRENDGRSFADFLHASAVGKYPKLYSDGSALRTFLFSADAIIAMLGVLERGENMKTYNIGSDTPISILDFARKVSEIAGLQGRVLIEPAFRKGLIESPNRVIIPDLSRINELGWKSRNSLDEAIRNTLNYIKSHS